MFLLDPDRLQAGLTTAEAEYRAVDERRQWRLAAIDREIQKLRARVARIVEERLDAERGSETERVLKEKGAQVEEAIRKLEMERHNLDTEPAEGLSPDAVLSLREFAREVREGLDLADDADRRHVYELLKLRGTVRLDNETGMKLGRRHRFLIEWLGVVGLLDTDREYKKTRVRYFTPEMDEWEAKHLADAAGRQNSAPLREAQPTGASAP